ncbi:hypothetical protein HMPREF1861_02097 [Corynebacterium kroppenstedtii]|nr:hypothetical protein HMPREF1861_02097 [Corynebacterium kroppenstedtii]
MMVVARYTAAEFCGRFAGSLVVVYFPHTLFRYCIVETNAGGVCREKSHPGCWFGTRGKWR